MYTYDKEYTVYIHKNRINGKMYVGITCQPTDKRWKNGKGYPPTTHFGRAINKYGWDAFCHEIVVSGISEEKAKEIEKNLVNILDLTDQSKGYNEAVGGGGGGMYGKHQSESAKKRISEARKIIGFTEEHKKHISESKKGTRHHMARKVYQYSKDGKLIGEWLYMSMASTALHINKSSISACCLGKRPTAGGYVWSYEQRG